MSAELGSNNRCSQFVLLEVFPHWPAGWEFLRAAVALCRCHLCRPGVHLLQKATTPTNVHPEFGSPPHHFMCVIPPYFRGSPLMVPGTGPIVNSLHGGNIPYTLPRSSCQNLPYHQQFRGAGAGHDTSGLPFPQRTNCWGLYGCM